MVHDIFHGSQKKLVAVVSGSRKAKTSNKSRHPLFHLSVTLHPFHIQKDIFVFFIDWFLINTTSINNSFSGLILAPCQIATAMTSPT